MRASFFTLAATAAARIVIDLHAGILSEKDEDEVYGVADSAGNNGNR
jgi:hypothetical protein